MDSLLLVSFAGNRKAKKESRPLRLERTGGTPRANTLIDRALALVHPDLGLNASSKVLAL